MHYDGGRNEEVSGQANAHPTILDKFFPLSKLPGLHQVPLFIPGCYHNTVNAAKEKDLFDHFVSL